jgi:asparagine synthase (glutamine-hydrolysing)
MCGILAVVGDYRYEEIPSALLERGPDDSGIYEDEHVQLMQTRLEITKAKVQLPFQTDRHVLLFNGEIYNWKAFGGMNEFQSIINAYLNDMMEDLDGQFSIIIYDKVNHTIKYFQDMFKIHVVYKTEYKGSTIYASNLRSLPEVKFKEISMKGYGNISTAEVL